MKKNNMFRIASVLLVAVLLSTCAISGAFAKYTTGTVTTEASSARVAKWGISLAAAPGSAAFGNTYATHDEDADDAITASVSTTVDKVVAPGTNGTFGTFTVTDENREVAVRVKSTATFTMSENWTVDNDEGYFPIVIKVNGTAVPYAASDDIATIEAAVEKAVCNALVGKAIDADPNADGSFTKDYPVNQNVATNFQTVTVTWDWAFETENNASDVNDTKLGEAAETDVLEFSLAFGLTIDQID